MSTEVTLQAILERLTNIEKSLGLSKEGDGGSSSTSGGAELPRSIKAFDSYASSFLDPFVSACDKLGEDAKKVGDLVKAAWMEMRAYLLRAASCKEPASTQLGELLKDVTSKMKDVAACVNRNQWEKHTKAVNEGVQALSWLCVKPAPRDHIESFIGGSDYWANAIRKEFRLTNSDQIAFCDTFKTLLLELMVYVKEYHTTGVTWNSKGCDVASYSASSAAAAAPSASAPVATTPVASATKPTAAAVAPTADLFAALSKEGAITSGLKKVTKEQQTWREEAKNNLPPPVVPAYKKPAAVAVVTKGPPKLEFQAGANKWLVENQTDANGPVNVVIADKKEMVYIHGCINATINIEGKCKGIVVDTCKKTLVYFLSAFGTCEVVNCQRIQIHCKESVPSVAIDKTDGINVFLPATSLDTNIVASKSSEMNISFPDVNGDIIERPIPEQYVHRIKGLSVTAEVSDLYH